jgi:DNA processing protein
MSYQDAFTIVKPSIPWDASRLGWLALAWFDGFGSRTLQKLGKRFGSRGDEAWSMDASVLREIGCHESTVERFARYRSNIDPIALKQRLDCEEISFALVSDARYPSLLQHIADPPYALFVRGQIDVCTQNSVAVVGTRRNTSYGRRVAEWLGEECARAGLTVVSGLAGGIDTIVHESALRAGGTCVAVLGSGVDDDGMYPRSNVGLSRRILKSGGCVVSEFPPGTEALKHHFPLRNRLIAGLSRATVIVEAAEKSGSLITAHLALEQNRDVFAVPGPITHAQSGGTNRLLAMGAIPCTSPDDVIRHVASTVVAAPPRPLSISDGERSILALLDEPKHVDDIARSLGLSISVVNGQLARLEMHGWIALHGPHTYARTRA